MERKILEEKVREIIRYMKNEKISLLAEKSINSFSDLDLQKLFNFWESWDNNLLASFLIEKTKDFMWEVQAIKFAKWKIVIWKNIRIEKAEKAEEEKELENLLNQL